MKVAVIHEWLLVEAGAEKVLGEIKRILGEIERKSNSINNLVAYINEKINIKISLE